MNLRHLERIWHITGSLALAPGQSSDEAFRRLDPLFRMAGTGHERRSNTLTFRKQDQAAQDKMSIFDGGVLRIEEGGAGSVLHYRLVSRTLLFCFLAPLLFLAFAQLTIVLGKFEAPPKEATSKAEAAKRNAPLPQSPIDKALGAPAPERPKKDKPGGEDKKSSPTAAYVFAAIFATLYIVGRILEARLVKSLFRNRLQHP